MGGGVVWTKMYFIASEMLKWCISCVVYFTLILKRYGDIKWNVFQSTPEA